MCRWCSSNVINRLGEKIMRLLPIAILVSLSACASVPDSDDVSIRAASWHGAPADELIAILGEPKISKKGDMSWRFMVRSVAPKSTQARSRYRPFVPQSSPNSGLNRSSLSGIGTSHRELLATSHGYSTHVGFSGSGYKPRPRFCTYLAYVENGIVSKLITLGNSRAGCVFEELPLRSTD